MSLYLGEAEKGKGKTGEKENSQGAGVVGLSGSAPAKAEK